MFAILFKYLKISSQSKVKQDSFIVGYLSGATGACMSETITITLDTAKVRMILNGMFGKYATITSTIKTIMSEQGTPRLWKGTLPACMRQCVFAGLKLALYEPLRNKLCKNEERI